MRTADASPAFGARPLDDRHSVVAQFGGATRAAGRGEATRTLQRPRRGRCHHFKLSHYRSVAGLVVSGKGGQRGPFRVPDGCFRRKCLGMNATAPLQNDSAPVQNGFAPVQNRSAACKVILHPCKVVLHPCRMAAHPCGTPAHPCNIALRPRKVALQARNLILHGCKTAMHGCKTAMHARPDTRNGSAAPEQPARANMGNSAKTTRPRR